MKPEDIRRLYRQEDAATDAEAKALYGEVRTDPDMARNLLLTLYALSGDDPEFDGLLSLVLKAGMMQLLAERVHEDDAFALKIGELIADAMEQTQPRPRTPRGRRQPKAKTA